jgi:predicted small metal-binding protein
MGKVLKCGDLNPGCKFEAHGNTEDEVLQKAAEHAKTVHNMQEIPHEVLTKARSAIHEDGGAGAKKASG